MQKYLNSENLDRPKIEVSKSPNYIKQKAKLNNSIEVLRT